MRFFLLKQATNGPDNLFEQSESLTTAYGQQCVSYIFIKKVKNVNVKYQLNRNYAPQIPKNCFFCASM